jgi:hypothetical protein
MLLCDLSLLISCCESGNISYPGSVSESKIGKVTEEKERRGGRKGRYFNEPEGKSDRGEKVEERELEQ